MKVFLATCQIHQNIYHSMCVSMCVSMCELLYKMIEFSYVSIKMIFLNNFPTSLEKSKVWNRSKQFLELHKLFRTVSNRFVNGFIWHFSFTFRYGFTLKVWHCLFLPILFNSMNRYVQNFFFKKSEKKKLNGRKSNMAANGNIFLSMNFNLHFFDFVNMNKLDLKKKKVQSLNSGSRDFRHTRTSRLQL
jgi:hypothetical protein